MVLKSDGCFSARKTEALDEPGAGFALGGCR